jgi:hypothetical protein
MRKIILTGAAVVAMTAGVANAADMAVKAPPMAPPVVGCGYNAITAANNQISLDYAGLNKEYTEFNSPGPVADPALPLNAVLDTEKGWVHGLSVTGSAMFNLGSVCNVYVFGRGSFFDGKTDYWQPLGRLGGQSNAKIWEGDFRFGKGFDLAPNFMLTPYLGVGARSWDRDLCQGGACFGFGFHENYSHSYVGAGLMGQFAVTPALVLSASGLVGGTFDSTITGGPLANGNPAIVNFRSGLGNSTIYKIEGSLDYAFTRNFHGNIGVEYTEFRYGQSALFVTDRLGNMGDEPDSRTRNVTVRAGLGWAFGAGPVVAKY